MVLHEDLSKVRVGFEEANRQKENFLDQFGDIEDRIIKGESTGSPILDYVILHSRLENVSRQEANLSQLEEKLKGHVGEEILLHEVWESPGGCIDHGPIWTTRKNIYRLAIIKEGHLEFTIKGEKGWERFGQLNIITGGYSNKYTRDLNFRNSPRSIDFENENLNVPGENAKEVAVGDDEINQWRQKSKGNEGIYQELKEALTKGLEQSSQIPETV